MREKLGQCETIVIKAGTAVVSNSDGSPSLVRLSSIVEQASELLFAKKRVVLVTSGAVGCGRSRLRKQVALNRSFRDLRAASQLHEAARTKPYDSACAAAGQLALMSLYSTLFSAREIDSSQFLVTQQDFEDDIRKRNLKYALSEILDVGMVPIINENDAVSGNLGYDLPEEASFSDNDGLAALVAHLIDAQVLVLLSDVDGLYDRPPSEPDAQILDWCTPKDRSTFQFGQKSISGRGGMEAKVAAAFRAIDFGTPRLECVALANGARQGVIHDLLRGEKIGTIFTSDHTKNAYHEKIETKKNEYFSILTKQLERGREAARKLEALEGSDRSQLLEAVAAGLARNKAKIISANEDDIKKAQADLTIDQALKQRLKLSADKIDTLALGAKTLAETKDPLHQVLEKRQVAHGLILERRACALGVILIIFEARPEALIQIACLALRAGCGLVLKGGKEAHSSNTILHEILCEALAQKFFSRQEASDLIMLLHDRKAVSDLLANPNAKDYIDLVVPRGSNQLVKHIQASTKIPVLGHADGICHIFIDTHANFEKVKPVVIDAKTDYPAACNTCETILIHKDLLTTKKDHIIQSLLEPLKAAGVDLFPGPDLAAGVLQDEDNAFKSYLDPAHTQTNLKTEYGTLACTIEITNSLDDAIQHINTYSSHHTDAILTEDSRNADTFLKKVDSACVFHNASTRFADGFRFGLGAEIGVSTARIHARGPVGVQGFLTYKWCLASDEFHTQAQFASGAKHYTHTDMPLI